MHRPTAKGPVLAAAAAAVLALVLGTALAAHRATGPERRTTGAADPLARSSAQPGPAPADALPEVPVRRAAVPSAGPVAAPTAVAIDALDVALPVEPVGVQADGQMEIPPAAEVAGWYRFGAAPGDPAGTAVVAAHVDSVASAGLGPFARLRDLAPGDVVAVTRADGAVVRYAVRDVVSVAKPTVTWDDVFERDGAHRLVLVTCGGVWHEERRSYSDNVIVTAEPLDG